MILSDFLSKQMNDDSNPHELLPISFNMCQILYDNYYSEKYLIQIKSQAKSSGIKLPAVDAVGKNLDPNLKPEKQHAIPKQGSMERLHIGQRRAGSRRKRPDPINQSINQPIQLVTENSWKDRNRNRKKKPYAYQGSDAFHKQHEWQDDKQ